MRHLSVKGEESGQTQKDGRTDEGQSAASGVHAKVDSVCVSGPEPSSAESELV
ncbi:hypothetical protein JOB18_026619 [Solea senegalensis]|uniref:Uncharacterized protein n=1 Tax=Solea senegalensis TaxID=28829 RepID=A0AAV6RPE1_SOLSE|nr:hypothetical protein JOB18_026619 [Solea senegalensis]